MSSAVSPTARTNSLRVERAPTVPRAPGIPPLKPCSTPIGAGPPRDLKSPSRPLLPIPHGPEPQLATATEPPNPASRLRAPRGPTSLTISAASEGCQGSPTAPRPRHAGLSRVLPARPALFAPFRPAPSGKRVSPHGTRWRTASSGRRLRRSTAASDVGGCPRRPPRHLVGS